MKGVLGTARPFHQLKNAIVFAPLIFDTGLRPLSAVSRLIPAFAAFCLAAWAVYLFNDLVDAASDARVASKRQRPAAAGGLKRRTGYLAAAGLALAAIVIASVTAIGVALAIVAYLVINLTYSLGLREFPMLDVFLPALGYPLRVAAGAAATASPFSWWFFLVVGSLAWTVIIGRRYKERLDDGRCSAGIRRWLDLSAIISLFLYLSYCTLSATATGAPGLLLTLPIFIVAVWRYRALALDDKAERLPHDAILQDPVSIGMVVFWAITAAVVLRLPQ